jgi:hypothetical protein
LIPFPFRRFHNRNEPAIHLLPDLPNLLSALLHKLCGVFLHDVVQPIPVVRVYFPTVAGEARDRRRPFGGRVGEYWSADCQLAGYFQGL